MPKERPRTGTGLTSAEVRQRLAELGPNAVSEEAPPRWRTYLAKFWSPIPWLLEAAMVVEIALGKYVEAVVIAGLLLFNAILGLIQEGRAGAALAALKKRLAPTALARRDGEWVKLPASELVPGDAVRLPLGSLVPADARVMSGSVIVDQPLLTGESVPVDANAGDAVYAGSLIRRGQATAEVTATGDRTYFGRAVEVQDVEIVGTFAHSVQHQHVIRSRIAHVPVEPHRRPRATDKARGCHGIAACEQGHVMTQADEFLRKIRDNPFRALEGAALALLRHINVAFFRF